MNCTRCGTANSETARFCGSCGTAMEAPPPPSGPDLPPLTAQQQVASTVGKAPAKSVAGAPPTDDGASPRRPIGLITVVAVVVALVLGGAVTAVVLSTGGEGSSASSDAPDVEPGDSSTTRPDSGASDEVDRDEPTTSTVPAGPTRTIEPTRVAAPLQTEPSENACGTTTTFEPTNLLDHLPQTAWRTEGDGTGRRITLNLGGPTRVTEVGLINGYAKVDPCDGTDRYVQNRRITSVRWTFDDGTSVTQDLDPSDRTVQRMAVDAQTVRVQLEILATTPPGDRDYTPVSDIEIRGTN